MARRKWALNLCFFLDIISCILFNQQTIEKDKRLMVNKNSEFYVVICYEDENIGKHFLYHLFWIVSADCKENI